MNPVCARCTLRLQRAANADTTQAARRTFSQTTTRRKGGVPTFTDTSNPSLNTKLEALREKHFIPAYLSGHDRSLIYKLKNKQSLEDNPQVAIVGKEEIKLEWVNRRSEIPNGKQLVKEIIHLAAENDEWANLPNLLVGLNHTKNLPPPKQMESIIRKAVNQGRIGIIIQCLQQADRTGMTLKSDTTLRRVVQGLRETAQTNEWSEEDVSKALRGANQVALMLETEEHSRGRTAGRGDARRRPEIIAVFLELEAVNAYKFHGAQDVNGKVKAYAERLLACIGDVPEAASPLTHAPVKTGPQLEMINGVPIWHGLSLAQKILGPNMPQADAASKIVADYEAGLARLAKAIEATDLKEGSYNAQALSLWNGCIRE